MIIHYVDRVLIVPPQRVRNALEPAFGVIANNFNLDVRCDAVRQVPLEHQPEVHGHNFPFGGFLIFEKFKNEICAVLLPTLSEKERLSLITKLDIPYADIVSNEKKITELLASKVSEEGMIKTLQSNNKASKLKM